MPIYIVGIRNTDTQIPHYEAYDNVVDADERASKFFDETGIVVGVEQYFSEADAVEKAKIPIEMAYRRARVDFSDTLRAIRQYIETHQMPSNACTNRSDLFVNAGNLTNHIVILLNRMNNATIHS